MVNLTSSLLVVATIATAFAVAAEPARTTAPSSDEALIDGYWTIATAFERNDHATLRSRLTDDFQLVDHEGKSDSKESVLKAIADGILKFDKCTTGRVPTKEIGEVGIVQGPVVIELTYGRTKPIRIQSRFALTAVLVKQDKRWLLTAAHLTQVKPKER